MEITSASVQLGKVNDSMFKGWAKISIDGILQVTGIRLYESFNAETNERYRYFRFPEYQTNPNNTGGVRVGIPIVNAKDKEFRNKVATAIFTEYDRVLSKKKK